MLYKTLKSVIQPDNRQKGPANSTAHKTTEPMAVGPSIFFLAGFAIALGLLFVDLVLLDIYPLLFAFLLFSLTINTDAAANVVLVIPAEISNH